MKRTVALLLVLIILLAVVVPAAAQSDEDTPARFIPRFIVTGRVRAVNLEAGTITIAVLRYLPWRPLQSRWLTIQTNDRTVFRFFRPTTTNVRPSIRDVRVGEKILVYGIIINRVHVARLVILRLPEVAAVP